MDPIFRYTAHFIERLVLLLETRRVPFVIHPIRKADNALPIEITFLTFFFKMSHNGQYYMKKLSKSHLQGALNLLILVSANRWLTVNPRCTGNSQMAFVDRGVQLGQHPGRQLDKHAESKRHSTAAMHYSHLRVMPQILMCINSFRHRIKLHKF